MCSLLQQFRHNLSANLDQTWLTSLSALCFFSWLKKICVNIRLARRREIRSSQTQTDRRMISGRETTWRLYLVFTEAHICWAYTPASPKVRAKGNTKRSLMATGVKKMTPLPSWIIGCGASSGCSCCFSFITRVRGLLWTRRCQGFEDNLLLFCCASTLAMWPLDLRYGKEHVDPKVTSTSTPVT